MSDGMILLFYEGITLSDIDFSRNPQDLELKQQLRQSPREKALGYIARRMAEDTRRESEIFASHAEQARELPPVEDVESYDALDDLEVLDGNAASVIRYYRDNSRRAEADKADVLNGDEETTLDYAEGQNFYLREQMALLRDSGTTNTTVEE